MSRETVELLAAASMEMGRISGADGRGCIFAGSQTFGGPSQSRTPAFHGFTA
jgi:hypothetical protein